MICATALAVVLISNPAPTPLLSNRSKKKQEDKAGKEESPEAKKEGDKQRRKEAVKKARIRMEEKNGKDKDNKEG
jgi:hypothetical protein